LRISVSGAVLLSIFSAALFSLLGSIYMSQECVQLIEDDLAAYRKRVVAEGGTIKVEEQEVPGTGWFSLFTDPEGRMMGPWKNKAQ